MECNTNHNGRVRICLELGCHVNKDTRMAALLVSGSRTKSLEIDNGGRYGSATIRTKASGSKVCLEDIS